MTREGANVRTFVHPQNPKRLYAGASPIHVYRSDDGGDNWKKLADPNLPDRVIMAFACRVMRLDVDPNAPDDVFATLEANGAMRSRNAGESWEDCTADLIRFCEEPKYRSRIGSQTEIEGMLDGHALSCSAAAPGTVRGDFSISKQNNLVHGSDSPESAEREIALWFRPEEVADYEIAGSRWVFADA